MFLSEVTNLQNVTVIEEDAFKNDFVLKLDLSNTKIEIINKSAFQGVCDKNIVLPYYFSA